MFAYILVVIDCLVFFRLVEYYMDNNYPVCLLQKAVRPDHFLLNTRLYVLEAAPSRSRSRINLERAITEMKRISQQTDSLSRIHIGTALADLSLVKAEMDSGVFSVTHINNASIQALNALTYYQIKSAEYYVLNDMSRQAVKALEFGMQHIRNALKFAKGTKKDHEIQVFSEMKSITESNNMDKQEVIEKLEFMLDELEDLEVAYHHD